MSTDHDHESTLDVMFAAAVAFELRPFARHLGIETLERGLTHATHGAGRVALLSAGMGRSGDEKFRAALRDLKPVTVINVGIAGALDLAHPAGSTWVVEEWRHQHPPHGAMARADAALSADIGVVLDKAGIAWGNAVAVTVDEPLHDADQRDRIRDGSGAHLVEMEGASWATIAADHDVPFAAVRVISDHANRPLRDEVKAAGAQFREAVDALDAVARALLSDNSSSP